MADPMTQSSQITSSQGLADGPNSATAKDSKLSDSFLSSSPVSLIQSPQDKRVVLGSDKHSEGVATSLRFLSQPGSFSPVTYGSEASGLPGGSIDRAFKDPEKKEFSDSSFGSLKQDSSPIKTSPVSERIKALEALAAKKNDSDNWSDGSFPHFKDRHYEKSPTEAPSVSPSPFQRKAGSTEQDSPESPFEVLGDSQQGKDFEDTADWMQTHLPPAPDFDTEDPDLDETKDAPAMQSNGQSKELMDEAMVARDVSETFVGVPDAFMDTPVDTAQLKDDYNEPAKQDSVEEESEFDLSFLPTAYMWDKQEKSDTDTQGPSGIPAPQDSKLPASPAPPAGFESPSAPLSPPAPQESQQKASGAKQVPCGDSEPTEVLEVDSSGESDDTVIEDAACIAATSASSKDATESVALQKKDGHLTKPEKQPIQVPIINVIETDEQVLSDEEEEQEEEEEDEEYKVVKDPIREAPRQDPNSETTKSESEESKPVMEISQPSPTDSYVEYSPKHHIIQDDYNAERLMQPTLVSKDPNSKVLQAQPLLSENSQVPNETLKMSSFDTAKPAGKTAEMLFDLPDNYEDLSNDTEPSIVDSYLDNYSTQDLTLKEKPKSDFNREMDMESVELSKSNFLPDDLNTCKPVQQTFEEPLAEDSLPAYDDTLDERQLNFDIVPEPSPSDSATGMHIETLLPQNNVPCVDYDDLKGMMDLGDFSLVSEDDYSPKPVGGHSFPQPPGTTKDLIAELKPNDDIAEDASVTSNSEPPQESGVMTQRDVPGRQHSPETTSDPESIEPECSVTAATDSFVEFMRECLNSRQDEEPEDHGPNHTTKDTYSVTGAPSSQSPPAMVLDLEQERLTIRALKELGSGQEEDDENILASVKPLLALDQQKVVPQPPSKPESSVTSAPTPTSTNKPQSETSLAKEVEAIDIWVAEAYHLAEHVLAAILTHLSVVDLVHWRDPKKSGVVFGVSLLLLLSLAAFSVISVVSYLLLALLCVTITFRMYKSVIQAVQKSGNGHPFKALMEKDVSVPPETFRKHVDMCLTHINCALKKMSRLFLVEDLVDSLKLAMGMWLLTYVGAVFNGITILILADILLFSLPPVYEKNKTNIDHYVGIARTQVNTTITKLQGKLPGAMKRSKVE